MDKGDYFVWIKLPVVERCVHGDWKARVSGYGDAAKLFRTINDEDSPEWLKFTGLIKNFVMDSNAVAQRKGLDAALLFVDKCGHAGEIAREVISGIVATCFRAPNMRNLAIKILLMFVQIGKAEAVFDELVQGFDHRNPEIVAGCIIAVNQALHEFGLKAVRVQSLFDKVPKLLMNGDIMVADEAKSLTIELFRWIGPAKTRKMPEVMLNELYHEFYRVMFDHQPRPTRLFRSHQQQKFTHQCSVGNESQAEGGEASADLGVDPADSLDPVEFISKLPEDFFEKIESKKWQERKKSLDALETLISKPQLQSGDYGKLIGALNNVLTKDSHVVLVESAATCLAYLAKGMGKEFQPYSGVCITAVLEKFKEKKVKVVTALRNAIDAMYLSTNLEAIKEDVIAALANKNPAVKSETALFLAHALTKTEPADLNKKLIEDLVTALLKNLSDSNKLVRQFLAEALNTASNLLGEKSMAPFLTDADKVKIEEIKDYIRSDSVKI